MAKKISNPPNIDGILDDIIWQETKTTPPFGNTNGQGSPTFETKAALIWDDQFLYVAFWCEDPDIWAQTHKHDDPIYKEEVVEIFLDPDDNQATYFELEVNPNNIVFDAYFPTYRQKMDLGWKSKMKSAVKIDGKINDLSRRDKGWQVEVAIPFSSFKPVIDGPPNPGDQWRMNLFRIERSRQGGGTQAGAFSPPIRPDFHNLDKMGYLRFED